MQHVQDMGPNLFVHNENYAYIIPCVTACSDIMHASRGMCTQARRTSYVYMACQKILMDMPFMQAEQYLSKLTTSHFSTLNIQKIYFLITWASKYHHQQIPENSMVKLFHN